jgi:hypothetical protein
MREHKYDNNMFWLWEEAANHIEQLLHNIIHILAARLEHLSNNNDVLNQYYEAVALYEKNMESAWGFLKTGQTGSAHI